METRRDVFQAIADPTRRQIIAMVAQGPHNLNAIAGQFDMSRQAVSLHVKILAESGLVNITQQGRERYCEARLEALGEVEEWVEECRRFWKTKFSSLENYLDHIQKPDKPKI